MVGNGYDRSAVSASERNALPAHTNQTLIPTVILSDRRESKDLRTYHSICTRIGA